MNLYYFKLVTQEEIIAPAEKTQDGWYVKNPAQLVHLQDYKIALANWLPYTKIDEGRTIPNAAVVIALDVADDMEDYYTKWLNPNMTDTIKVNEKGEVQLNK
jgi:hypothetical protein